MDNQDLFDKVAKHLLTQGRKAFTREECKYRLIEQDGTVLKCAVGCLIPDDLYDPCIEGLSIDSEGGEQHSSQRNLNIEKLNRIISGIDAEQVHFLGRLQHLHDTWEPGYWRRQLRYLALDENLSPAILDTLPDIA